VNVDQRKDGNIY